LNKRSVFIAIFIVSIFGLAFVQYQYLKVGLNLAKVQFNDKVERSIVDIKKGLSTENELTFLIASAMQRDTSFFRTNPDSIIDASSYFLNDFLREQLVQRGIETDFSYTLGTRDSSYYLKSPTIFEKEEETISYPIVLDGYLPNSFDRRFILKLSFKNLNRYFLSQLNGLTLPSLLFLIGIVAVVIWALRTYYWQRKVITTTDAFINNLTHELKTPVFSIGLASKMLEDKVGESGETFVAIIKQQANRLSNHIEKVLELATLERKRTAIELRQIDFYPDLEKICNEFNVLVSMENVDFSATLKGEAYMIMGETFHLQNMVNNLLDNAKKYSDFPKISLTAWKDEKKMHIQIKDNGKGIADDEQKKVFEKYYRVTNGDTHNSKGFGLGLNYVKTIVKQHKGQIKLSSKLNMGTTVTVQIPLVYGNQ